MKGIDKLQLLQHLEERVKQHVFETIHHFKNKSESTLLAPASNGGWSIAQCLDHLNSYGRYYLPEIRKGIEAMNRKAQNQTFVSTWLGSYFKKMMEPNTGKRKYKAFKNHFPNQHLDAFEVVAEFINQQEVLITYLHKAKEANLDTPIPISISKWVRLKMGDVFQFVIAHNERHLQQAKRNL